MARITYEQVEDFVLNNSECLLISDEFEGTKKKMDFVCECGNPFSTTFEKFKLRNKRQCNSCGAKQRNKDKILKFEEIKNFIENESESGCKLISTSGDGERNNFDILCSCGSQFNTKFRYFKYDNKRTCSKCSKESRSYYRELSLGEVETYVKNNSNCKLASASYINTKTPLDFICECQKPFSVSFEIFKSGKHMCNDCSNSKLSKERSLTIDDVKNFIEIDSSSECKLISKYYKNNSSPLDIICPCGDIFTTDYAHFHQAYKRTCNKCSKYYSKGELRVIEFLKNNDFAYSKDFKFANLRLKALLKFDFAIFNCLNELIYLIEYDGIQHFEPVEKFGGLEEFKRGRERDLLKNRYCVENNINLIRIPYWDFNRIEDILEEYLNPIKIR